MSYLETFQFSKAELPVRIEQVNEKGPVHGPVSVPIIEHKLNPILGFGWYTTDCLEIRQRETLEVRFFNDGFNIIQRESWNTRNYFTLLDLKNSLRFIKICMEESQYAQLTDVISRLKG